MTGTNFLLNGFGNPVPRTWQWWVAALLGVTRTFLVMVGLMDVLGAPLTLHEVVGPFVLSSIAIHTFTGYRDWHRSNGRFA